MPPLPYIAMPNIPFGPALKVVAKCGIGKAPLSLRTSPGLSPNVPG
jgi:hypothetical protein